jgi:hypothetical protein
MPTRKLASQDRHSIADLQAELVRRHQRRVAECKAAVAAATICLARAEADLGRAVSQMDEGRAPLSGRGNGHGAAHGNAARPDTTLRDAVLRIVTAFPGPVRTADIKRIAESMGYSVGSVSTLIKFHARQGNIRQARYGWWEATTRSEQA